LAEEHILYLGRRRRDGGLYARGMAKTKVTGKAGKQTGITQNI
jgi:hypothetical protein